MKTSVKKSNSSKTTHVFLIAKDAINSIFYEKEDKDVLLSNLKEKLICNKCGTACYTLIRMYAGTKIEDICWEALDAIEALNNSKLKGIWIS